MRVSGLLNQSLYAVALTVCMFMLCGCNDLGTKECPRCQTFKSGMSRNLSGQKPIVNVYLENSGSIIKQYGFNEDWWRGQKEAVEAKYANQGQ